MKPKLSWKKIPQKYWDYIEAINNGGSVISVDIKKGFAGEDGLTGWIMDSWGYGDALGNRTLTDKQIYEDLNLFLSTVKPISEVTQ
jgi:hypothetical protein